MQGTGKGAVGCVSVRHMWRCSKISRINVQVEVLYMYRWNGKNVENPIDEDDIIGDAEQIQLTNMPASGAPSGRRGAPLASIFFSLICEVSPIIGLR